MKNVDHTGKVMWFHQWMAETCHTHIICTTDFHKWQWHSVRLIVHTVIILLWI